MRFFSNCLIAIAVLVPTADGAAQPTPSAQAAKTAQPAQASQPSKPTPKTELQYGTKKLELPFGETTEVKGKLPAGLAGLWLVSENHALPGGKFFPVLQLYQIATAEDGALRVNWLVLELPADVKAKLAQAQKSQQEWSPSAEDVKRIAEALQSRVPGPDPKLRGRHVLSEAKEFAANVKGAAEAKKATFAIQSLFQPTDRPPYGQSYYVENVSTGELRGQLTMGAIPEGYMSVPLPIGTKGTFRWIRLSQPPEAKQN
jgi:hypothetical protein